MPSATHIGECVECRRTMTIASRGMCRTCYASWRQTRPPAFTKSKETRECSVEGCNARAHGQGLCNKHLQRFRKHGTTNQGRVYTLQRPVETLKTQHDLYPVWREFNRERNARPVCSEWKNSFDAFVRDVGDRPSARHHLHPLRIGGVLGPNNFEWRKALIERIEGETEQEFNTRYKRAHREAYGHAYRGSDLMSRYGVTIEQVSEMAEGQNHCCAICGQPEKEERSGYTRHLAVDHDHATGKVRQLLCQNCNKMIGYAKDDPAILTSAIAYLAKHTV